MPTQSHKIFLVLTAFVCQLLLLLTPSAGNAEPLSVSRLTQEQGLSQSTVYSIAQDNDGFIWFGTSDGIDIYDGHQLRHIRHDPDNRNSLSDNYIRSLLIDSKGNAWAGTLGGGLNKYESSSQLWTHFKASSESKIALPSNDIHTITESSDGMIWLGSNEGITKLDPDRGIIKNYLWSHFDPVLNTTSVARIIAQTQDGLMWIGTSNNGLIRFDPNTEKSHTFRYIFSDTGSISSNAINAIYEDSQMRLWVGTEDGGLNLFNRQSQQFSHFIKTQNGLNDTEVTSIIEDRDGLLWLGTWSGGLNRFDPSTRSFVYFRSSEANTASLSSNAVISLFEDHSGVLWAGTYDNGVNRIPYKGVGFPHYRYDPLISQGLESKIIWSFAEGYDGSVWIGTKRGLNSLKPADQKKLPEILSSPCPDVTKSLDIRSLAVDGEYLWLGTAGNGLINMHVKTCAYEKFINNPNDANSISNNSVRLLLKDKAANLWVGTSNGLNRRDHITGVFEQFNAGATDLGALPHARIRSLYEDNEGVIWVGTSGGLSRYDPLTKHFVTFTKEQGILSGNDVRSIYKDPQEILWVATGSGLTRYNLRNGISEFFREKQGLVNNTLYSIIPDENYLWITSNKGLARFNTQDFSIINYDIVDGLQSNEFNFNAYLKARTNNILIGGINGFNYFNPHRQDGLDTIPKLHLSVVIDNGEMFRSISELSLIELNPSDLLITFTINVLHYLNPDKNYYKYRLKGVTSEWQRNNSVDNQVHYAGLSPGNYLFEVKVVGANGKESDLTSLRVLVKQSPWGTWWAYSIYLLLAIIVIWGLLELKTATFRKRTLKLQEKIKENTIELHNKNNSLDEQTKKLVHLLNIQDEFYIRTAHELRTPLTFIRAPAEQLSSRSQDAQMKSEAATILLGAERLQRLIDQMLEAAISKKIHEPGVQTFDFKSYLQSIIESHKSSAVQKGITLISAPIPDAAVTLNRKDLDDIIHNLMSNAIKYTLPQGTVNIEANLEENTLLISIADTGIGISEADQKRVFRQHYRSEEAQNITREGNGIGLHTVFMAVNANGGDIHLDSQLGQGSAFNVHLPCSFSFGSETIALSQLVQPIVDFVTPHGRTSASDSPQLLIIEDDPLMQQLLNSLLQDQYELTFSATANNGIALARDLLPELILCDVMLPDGNGFDVTHTLKTGDDTGHIPIIQITALGDSQSKMEAYKNHADDYIVKPFSPEELHLRISAQIQNRVRQKEWCRQYFLTPQDSKVDSISVVVNPADIKFIEKLEYHADLLLSKQSCNLESIAEQMHQSSRTIQRKINNILGCTYTEYIQTYQLNKAKEYLKQGCSVKEAAYLSGFSDPAHFNRLFKGRFHTTPGKYKSSVFPAAQPRHKIANSRQTNDISL